MEERVIIEVKDHIAFVRLNRPDKMNALDEAMFQAIIKAGDTIENDSSIRVVVLSGEGKAFCAGIDLSNFSFDGNQSLQNQDIRSRTHGLANKWQKVAWQWRELSVPVIAAVHGVAFGGGLQIMLGADIKYVTTDTKLSILETKWGIIPDMAGTQLMRHSVRDDIIRELTYTHRIFSGEEAVKYGFATHLSFDPMTDATNLAKEIASKSPTAIVKAKEVLNAAPYLNVEEGLKLESEVQAKILSQHNQVEAVFSTLQKREANFKDFRKA